MPIKQTAMSFALVIILISGLITSCSRHSENSCKEIIDIATKLSAKADLYWSEEHEDGTGDYSKSEALLVEFDQIVVGHPDCFSEQEITFSESRYGRGPTS